MIGNMKGRPVTLTEPCVETDLSNAPQKARCVLEKHIGRRLLGREGDECCCHKCNNKRCVEVTHLYVGSYSDNTKDKVVAGTHHFVGGEVQRKSARLAIAARDANGNGPFLKGELQRQNAHRRWARWRQEHGRPPKQGDEAYLRP